MIKKIFPLFIMVFPAFLFAQSITYTQHIAPIIQYHCTGCHQRGEVAPIPFTTYEEVSSYANMIAYVTKTRYMPPWKALPTAHRFESERGLTDNQIDLIQQWIEGGLQKGESISNKVLTKKEKLEIENPDVVYAMAASFEQYGVYYDQFRVFVIPTHLEEDKEIASITFVPGNKSIVRSCQISIDTTSKSKALDDWDPQYGYFSFGEVGFVPMESRWYNWHPKKPVTHFPEGTGKILPKGAKLLLHIHYGPTGVAQKDSSYLQIKYAKKKIQQAVYTAPFVHPYNMTNDSFFVKANETVRVHAKFVVPFDMTLHGLFPQSHLLGRRWEIFTVDPSTKKSEVLLEIEDWDFKWKQMYDFKTAKLLKKGTVVHALAAYDNTLDNLSNPSNPPRDMPWGKRMFEELFLVFFKYSIPSANNSHTNFDIVLNQVNVSTPTFYFDLLTNEQITLSATLFSFDDSQQKILFSNQDFRKGKKAVEVSMLDLPFGNYYLELENTQTQEKQTKIIVYLNEKDFE